MRRNGTGKQRQRTVSATSQVYASVSKIKENDIATSHCACHHDHCDSFFTFFTHTHTYSVRYGEEALMILVLLCLGDFSFFPCAFFYFGFVGRSFGFIFGRMDLLVKATMSHQTIISYRIN